MVTVVLRHTVQVNADKNKDFSLWNSAHKIVSKVPSSSFNLYAIKDKAKLWLDALRVLMGTEHCSENKQPKF